MDGTLKGYFWYQGNSVDLTFDITGTFTFDNVYYVTAAEVVSNLLTTFSVFDHRHACILQYSNHGVGQPLYYNLHSNDDGEIVGEITIKLDHDTSEKLPKGVYTCSLTVSHPSGYYETLFDTSTCTFEVR